MHLCDNFKIHLASAVMSELKSDHSLLEFNFHCNKYDLECKNIICDQLPHFRIWNSKSYGKIKKMPNIFTCIVVVTYDNFLESILFQNKETFKEYIDCNLELLTHECSGIC